MRKRAGSGSDGTRLPTSRSNPPPRSPSPMPAVGARRSTRVFVPKASKPQPSEPTRDRVRVLRSGKHLAFSDSAPWLSFGVDATKPKNGFHLDADNCPKLPSLPVPPRPSTRSFGIVYSRKRRRMQTTEPKHDKRFGIVFARKGKRSKVAPFRPENALDHTQFVHQEQELPSMFACSSSREFASTAGFLDAHFSTLPDDDARAVLLVFLVDTSCPGSSHLFLRLLLPVLRWMCPSQRCKVSKLASFLSSAVIATVFASRGLHFVRLQRRRACALLQRTLLHCGWCELRGANKSRPLLSANFSAIPSYFQSLHSVIALGSIYLPAMIRQSTRLIGGAKQMYPHESLELDSGSLSIRDAEPAIDLDSDEPPNVDQDYVPLEQVAGVVVHGMRLKKHQRKRSSMRHPLSRQRVAAGFPVKAIGMKQGAVAAQPELKLPSTIPELSGETVQSKPALEISLELLENMDDSDASTPMGSNGKQRKSSLKSPVERMNERLALAGVRQHIDTAHCKANLLIIQADRCWREEGAEVMLELLDSKEWCIAVKIDGVTRISHKPSEQKFYVVNRFTHAYIWAVEDGWKLEFPDKWDWLLFRELQIEGRERNSQGKMIPIPGVHEVSDDMEGIAAYPFSRPVLGYIRTVDDEIRRALSRDSIYDMDSEDEQWLVQLDHVDSDSQSSHLNCISCEDFERIITTFEKDAYDNPEGANNKGQLPSRYLALGNGDDVRAVYRYWIHKRDKKGASLLRIFQGVPLRRGQLSQKTSIKKKRSFKRQRSQVGRGKPETFMQDNAEEEALQRVVEAERVAKQALETAVGLRSRAQSLMTTAELATYKSVMALRIAEAARVSDSSRDLVTAALD